MLLFENEGCTGEPAGMATVQLDKEASGDIRGLRVVALDAGGTATTSQRGSVSVESHSHGHSCGCTRTSTTSTETTPTPTSTPTPTPTGPDEGDGDGEGAEGEDAPPDDGSSTLGISRGLGIGALIAGAFGLGLGF